MAALEQSLDRRRAGPGRVAARGGGGHGRRPGDYGSMSKDELYELAQERELPGRSSMTKDELVAALAEGDATSKAS